MIWWNIIVNPRENTNSHKGTMCKTNHGVKTELKSVYFSLFASRDCTKRVASLTLQL